MHASTLVTSMMSTLTRVSGISTLLMAHQVVSGLIMAIAILVLIFFILDSYFCRKFNDNIRKNCSEAS